MRKYYIATSTFNFNNILSSESISPKAFYAKRGFGYSRWLSIPQNGVDNAIILYEKPFGFVRPASDVEDHPMLIEIQSEEDFPSVEYGIFYSDHTIYLSPWQVRFIFFTEQDKRVALSLSDSSLETKLMGLYLKRLVVENFPIKKVSDVKVDVKLNECAINKDYCINKIKGVLYGYYIGALLSTSPKVIRKYNILRELQNIFSAILSSEHRMPTSYQKERIRILFEDLQQYTYSFLYLQKYILNLNSEIFKDVVRDLKSIGWRTPSELLDENNIEVHLLHSKLDNNPAILWLKQEKDILERQIEKERILLCPSEEEIIVSGLQLSKVSNRNLSNEQEQELLKVWVNDTLLQRKYNGNISSFKGELSDEITIKAKEVYKESWGNSAIKQQLNQMRRYVRGQENDFCWNNTLVSSIAAVIAKGNDWNELFVFMQSKELFDYRLAFAFYGELNGFANLTRDFTDNLYDISDREYVATVYKELYGQLFGVDPTIQIGNCEMETKDTSSIIIDSMEGKLQSWLNDIRSYAINKGVIKTNKQKAINDLDEAIKQNGSNNSPLVFINRLSHFEHWRRRGGKGGNVAWERLNNYVCSRYVEPNGLFVSSRKYFYNDDTVWNVIKDLVPIKDRDNLQKDLRWFQTELQKPKNERSFYPQINVNDNFRTIEAFCRLKEKDKDGKPQAPYFTKELRDCIKQRLISYYADR